MHDGDDDVRGRARAAAHRTNPPSRRSRTARHHARANASSSSSCAGAFFDRVERLVEIMGWRGAVQDFARPACNQWRPRLFDLGGGAMTEAVEELLGELRSILDGELEGFGEDSLGSRVHAVRRSTSSTLPVARALRLHPARSNGPLSSLRSTTRAASPSKHEQQACDCSRFFAARGEHRTRNQVVTPHRPLVERQLTRSPSSES